MLVALGSLPDFTLQVEVRKTGVSGIKSLYDEKYGNRTEGENS
jgi:hypothetical protein